MPKTSIEHNKDVPTNTNKAQQAMSKERAQVYND
jgi:hypothetical protein